MGWLVLTPLVLMFLVSFYLEALAQLRRPKSQRRSTSQPSGSPKYPASQGLSDKSSQATTMVGPHVLQTVLPPSSLEALQSMSSQELRHLSSQLQAAIQQQKDSQILLLLYLFQFDPVEGHSPAGQLCLPAQLLLNQIQLELSGQGGPDERWTQFRELHRQE